MCSISMLDSTLNLRTPSCRPWRDLSAEQTISTPPFELEKIYASEWRQLSNFTTQYLDLARNSYQKFHFRSEIEPGKERKSLIFFLPSRVRTIDHAHAKQGSNHQANGELWRKQIQYYLYSIWETNLMCRRSVFVPCGIGKPGDY